VPGEPGDLAREFEPPEYTIRRWLQRADREEGRREDGPARDEKEETRRLRREVWQLQLEREIPARAAAWFAQETDSIPSGSSSS